MEKYTTKIENGILILPDEIVKKFSLKAGDVVEFQELENGVISLTFQKKEEINIYLPEEEIFMLMKMAHEKDITLNQLVNEILKDALNKF